MAEGDEYDIGELVGTITFEIPEQEKAKLDTMSENSDELTSSFAAFRKGGSAIFAAFSAVALLFGAGGFRQIIDLLFQTVQLLAAVVASPFVDALRTVAGETQEEAEDIEERGFFTPERLASLFFGALAAAAAALVGAPAWLTLGAGLATAWLSSIIDHPLWKGVKQIVAGLGGLFIGFLTDNLSMVQDSFRTIWQGLKNVGRGVWSLLPGQFKNALRDGAGFVRDASVWLWRRLKQGADWIQNNINPVDWAKQFVNWLQTVNWSDVFTFDIPGVDLRRDVSRGASGVVGQAEQAWNWTTNAVTGG